MKLDGIDGRVAIVTGAGGGIGEAYAKGLAAQGARVVVAEIVKDNGERVAEEIRKTGADAIAIEVDVASPESTQSLAERTAKAFGGVDFLVNNAAIFGDMKLDSLLTGGRDSYPRLMTVDMQGGLARPRACYRSMKGRGGGAIVNQSSTAAWIAGGYYSIAKHGINGLTHCLARELGPHKIRVNAIAPGP